MAKGFARFSPERRKEIASKGGRMSHAYGTAHRWTSEEAAAAGRKGGESKHRNRLAKQNRGPASGQ